VFKSAVIYQCGKKSENLEGDSNLNQASGDVAFPLVVPYDLSTAQSPPERTGE
jgi:hypothetical protein